MGAASLNKGGGGDALAGPEATAITPSAKGIKK